MDGKVKQERKSFNPRPCARGDLFSPRHYLHLHLFQSTPLREGRLSYFFAPFLDFIVSIHAPARGATWGVDYEART